MVKIRAVSECDEQKVCIEGIENKAVYSMEL